MMSQLEGDCNHLITTNSHQKLLWRCSICNCTFSSKVHHMRVSTGKCVLHANKFKNSNYYIGNVPNQLLRPIRAGLLQSIDIDQLIALITTLEPVPSQVTSALEPAAAALATARGYVESIVAGNYTRVQLLDSVFWGNDTVTRKNGHKYVHPPRKRPRVVALPSGGDGDPPSADAPPVGLQVAALPGGDGNPPADAHPEGPAVAAAAPVYDSLPPPAGHTTAPPLLQLPPTKVQPLADNCATSPTDAPAADGPPPLVIQRHAEFCPSDVIGGGVVDTEDRCSERPEYWEGLLEFSDDTVTRKDRRRYVHPPRPRKRSAPPLDGGDGELSPPPVGASPLLPFTMPIIDGHAVVPSVPVAADDGFPVPATPVEELVVYNDQPPSRPPDVMFKFRMPHINNIPVTCMPDDAKSSICRSYMDSIKTDLSGNWKDFATDFLAIPYPIGNHHLSDVHLQYCHQVLTLIFRASLHFRHIYDECKYLRLRKLLSESQNDTSRIMDILRWIESGMNV